jgi:uncharacterized membrane protein YkvA (DUF1232 family)
MIQRLRVWAKRIKSEITALALAARDPRTPWYAKVAVVCVVGYALSPIDLVPDPIPVLGYLDDLLLLPLGIALAIKLVPESVMRDCRHAATSERLSPSRVAAALIIALWIAVAIACALWLRSALS